MSKIIEDDCAPFNCFVCLQFTMIYFSNDKLLNNLFMTRHPMDVNDFSSIICISKIMQLVSGKKKDAT